MPQTTITPLLFRVLLCILLLVSVTDVAHAACTVQERGSLPFGATGGGILVPVLVNGIEAVFVLDTGAERSLVTPDAVRRLGLALDEWVSTTTRGVGGIVERPNAKPRSLTLGGVPLRRRTLNRDTSLTVGLLQTASGDGRPVDGLLGRDFLSLFDLYLDMQKRRLILYDVQGCTGRFLPWTGNYAGLMAEMPMGSALVLPITLDGRRLRALLDTGATSSVIVSPGMYRLGLTPASMAQDPAGAAHGIGPQSPVMRRHRFTSFQVGPYTKQSPTLWVTPAHVTPIVDALLGADWLAAQRQIWISFTTAQVFFAE